LRLGAKAGEEFLGGELLRGAKQLPKIGKGVKIIADRLFSSEVGNEVMREMATQGAEWIEGGDFNYEDIFISGGTSYGLEKGTKTVKGAVNEFLNGQAYRLYKKGDTAGIIDR